jgi:NAD+ synthase
MSSLILQSPQKTFQELTSFIRDTFSRNKKQQAVIAVSGGIDSALSLSLLSHALPKENITALLLPYGEQSYQDAQLICEFHQLPEKNRQIINIQPIVDVATKILMDDEHLKKYRLGNLMARTRMMVVYDFARRLDALVCGTENKSEHYLGYFTRFGDAASDLEPISQLYKTQVRQLVEHLQLPEVFLEKVPSAGLWVGQTDEDEMGFSYDHADQVLFQLIDQKVPAQKIIIEGISAETVAAVLQKVADNAFKHQVPYMPI